MVRVQLNGLTTQVTLEIGGTIKLLVMELLSIPKVTYMQVLGRIIWQMALVYKPTNLVVVILDNGRTISNMERVVKNGMMG